MKDLSEVRWSRVFFISIALTNICPVAVAHAQSWTFLGKIAAGGQIDAIRGPKDTVHLLSSRYYQIDAGGKVIADEAVGDEQQSSMRFPPAMAVGDDGSVHILTRHTGTSSGGFDLRYRRRSAAGKWDRDYLVGTRVARNYVVGAAWLGTNEVYLGTSEGGSNVWGDLHLWHAGVTGATDMGSFSGLWRADCDARMRAADHELFWASGKTDSGGEGTYLLHGTAGGQLVSQLQANKTVHKGTGRTGFPDIYVDGTKTVHLTFGSEQTVSYNQYTRLGKKRFATDKKLFSSLGNWHLSTGLSAVAASDDGQTIVVVALRSDGSQDANNSDILWALSQDGGVTFAPPQDLKHKTDAGEGRRRPRLVAIGNTFYLFYFDKGTSALSLATLAVVGGGTDGGAADIGGTDGGAADIGGTDGGAVDGVVSPRDAATADHGASAEGITADDAIAVSGDAHRNDATSPQSLAGGCGCRSAGMGARPAFISLVLVFFLIWRSRRRST